MTLLSIAEEAADYIGIGRPSQVAGAVDEDGKRIFAVAQAAGKHLARRNWPELELEHTFTTVNGTESYVLPTDFKRLTSDTIWDRTNYWSLRGGSTPAEWQIRKSALIATASLRKRFRIKASSNANVFFVDPTPTSADDLVFEYISSNWCQSSASSGQSSWQADDDTGIVDEDLLLLEVKWRLLKRIGEDYFEEKDEAERAIEHAFAASKGFGRISMSSDPTVIGAVNVPESGFG
ncbi:MAG: hypothetical protein ACR2QC_04260 [Gammaproteobacteria bacterium]